MGIDNRPNQYEKDIDCQLQKENKELKETLARRSAQVGDLKNKLIVSQQEVIELRKEKDEYQKSLGTKWVKEITKQ